MKGTLASQVLTLSAHCNVHINVQMAIGKEYIKWKDVMSFSPSVSVCASVCMHVCVCMCVRRSCIKFQMSR